MTTKPKAKRYRIRRDGALAEGTPPEGLGTAEVEAVMAPASATTAADDEGFDLESVQVPLHGEVSTSKDNSTNISIDAIRREGLTGRQLRMARRVAQKNGLAPTSDFDAVKLLRQNGIDPFQRSAVLELVSNDKKAEPAAPGPAAQQPPMPRTTQPVPQENVQLPQTVKQPTDSLPSTEVRQPSAAEDRASDILRIQREIASRRRRKLLLLMTRLAFFVMLPTFLAGLYYYKVATPLFATKSEFNITQADSQGSAGLGGLFQGTGLASQQDSTTVQSFLQSRDAMLRLDGELDFKDHWSQDNIDPIQRLENDSSNEAAYRVYKKRIKIGYDPTEGILKMEVIAADPETSQAFSERLIQYAEERVDSLTQKLRTDQMKGAFESFADAEAKVLAAQQRVLELQEQRGVIDPIGEAGGLMSQIVQFETQLRQKQLELDGLLANSQPNRAKVNGVRGDIGRLTNLVGDLRGSMTTGADGSASLATITGELRIAEADLATRQLLLQQAAGQVETARIEANRQTRYVTIGVRPVAPDEATYPRAFENTALAFVVFAGIYLMLSLTASVLREQVTS
jgi:capsular polysaccharide transport system permease protein